MRGWYSTSSISRYETDCDGGKNVEEPREIVDRK